jgi:hypothetical protein
MELRVGVYADVDGIARGGGYGLRYDVLREFAARNGSEPVRLNAYAGVDPRRMEEDPHYQQNTDSFHAALRDFGYKVVRRQVSQGSDDAVGSQQAASAEIDLAVDALTQSAKLDRVVLATGNGAFVRVVSALQNQGCRVEVIGFNGVSSKLRQEADIYVPGYLIPNLYPAGGEEPWGEVGSRVRGVCYSFSHDRGFGFMRYLKAIGPNLWNVDTRRDDSPYASAFAHESSFPEEVKTADLPNREQIFEFTLVTSDRGLQAKDITLAARTGSRD